MQSEQADLLPPRRSPGNSMAYRRLAKLSRPRLHQPILRARLFRVLDDARDAPVVWVYGPPGSGKTTLIATYLVSTASRDIWYLMDAGDSDPATFFLLLSEAIDTERKKRGQRLPRLTEEFLPDLEGFARRYLRSLFTLFPDSVIVLDNYHAIAQESRLHAMLAAGVEEIPPSASLIVIGRTPPPSSLARVLVHDQLRTIQWEQLRLDFDEVTAVAAQAPGGNRVSASLVLRQTGGWAAGVRLLLQSTGADHGNAEINDPRTLATTFDYFAAELFDSAPEGMRGFLLRVAFLPRFTLEMAQSVSEDPDADTYVRQLFHRQMFVERREAEVATYQFHDLFRAFLLHRGIQDLGEVEARRLAAASAHALLDAGHPGDAFGLFVRA